MEDAGPNLHELAQWARDRLADDSGADVGSALGRRRIDGPSSGTFHWRAFIQDAQQHREDDKSTGPVYGWRVVRDGDEGERAANASDDEITASESGEDSGAEDVPFANFGTRADPKRITPSYMAPTSYGYDWSDTKARPGGKAYAPMPTGWRNMLEGHGANLPRLALAGGAVFACAVTGFAGTSAFLNPDSSEAADSGALSFEDATEFATVDIPTPLTAAAQTFAQSTLADQGASGRSIGDDAALENLAREQTAAAIIPAPRPARIESQRVEPRRVEPRRVEPQRHEVRQQTASRAPERAAPAALERRVAEQRVGAQPQRVAPPQRLAAAERVVTPERTVAQERALAPERVAAPAPRESNENMFVATSLMGDDGSVVEPAAPAAPVARRLDMASVSTNYGAPAPIAPERPVSYTVAAAPVASAPRPAATAQASVRAPSQQQQHAGLWDGARRTGSGAAEDETGRRYEGAWRDYKPHGRGTLTFSNGVQYEGEFANGEPTGRGEYSNAQGEPLHGGDLFAALLNNS